MEKYLIDCEVLVVDKVPKENAWKYLCGVRNQDNENITYVGRTYNTSIKANVGDCIRVEFDRLNKFVDKKFDIAWYNWTHPKVHGITDKPNSIEHIENIHLDSKGKLDNRRFTKQFRKYLEDTLDFYISKNISTPRVTMISKLCDKLSEGYGMPIDEAKRFVLEKLGDQTALPNPEEEAANEPASSGQISYIESIENNLNELIGNNAGSDYVDQYLKTVGAGSIQELTSVQAGQLLGGLQGVQESETREYEEGTRKFWAYIITIGWVEPAWWFTWMQGLKGVGPLGKILGRTGAIKAANEATKLIKQGAKVGPWGLPIAGTQPTLLQRILRQVPQAAKVTTAAPGAVHTPFFVEAGQIGFNILQNNTLAGRTALANYTGMPISLAENPSNYEQLLHNANVVNQVIRGEKTVQEAGLSTETINALLKSGALKSTGFGTYLPAPTYWSAGPASFSLLTPEGMPGSPLVVPGQPTVSAPIGPFSYGILGGSTQIPSLASQKERFGQTGWIDPSTGEFKVARRGLLGFLLGPKTYSPQELAVEETRLAEEARAEEVAAANAAAILRSGPRRTISAPYMIQYPRTRV